MVDLARHHDHRENDSRGDHGKGRVLSARGLRHRAAELLALAFVLVLAAALALRSTEAGLTYDEGTYLLSVLDLQSGQALGVDVFAPQPPLFYDLVRLATWVFGADVPEVRRGIVVVFLAGVVGAYLLVRALVGPWAGVSAAALVVVAPPIPLEASRVHADLPAVALMLLALGLSAERRGGSRTQLTLVGSAGAVLAIAVGVKLSALIGIVPLALLLAWRPGRVGRAARLGGAALGALLVSVVVLVAHRHALGDLWSSLVDYRRAARKTPNLVGGREIVGNVLNLRAPLTTAFLLGIGLAAVRLVRERSVAAAFPIVPVLVLAVLGALALATYRPLHFNHLVLASALLGALAATLIGWGAATLPASGQAVIAGVVVLVALGALSHGWRRAGTELEAQDPRSIALAARVNQIVPADSLVLSDNPGIAYIARRATPGGLVDTARLRFETGSLTDAAVLETVERSCVAAVVAVRTFLLRPQLLEGFADRFVNVETTAIGKLYSGPRAPCPAGADTSPP